MNENIFINGIFTDVYSRLRPVFIFFVCEIMKFKITYLPYNRPWALSEQFLCLCPADIKNAREGTRSPRTAHEISLKRSYESVEGALKQGLSMRESPVSAPLEGEVLFPECCSDTLNFV